MPEHAMKANAEQLETLLLVDDDPLIAESLEFILSQHFHVLTADSRAAASALMTQSESTGIALVDLGLPPYPHKPDEGFELIRELISRNPHMRLILSPSQLIPIYCYPGYSTTSGYWISRSSVMFRRMPVLSATAYRYRQ